MEILCCSRKQAGRALLRGLLRGSTPHFVFNVLMQRVGNDLNVQRWISVRVPCAVFSLAGKVSLIKQRCS